MTFDDDMMRFAGLGFVPLKSLGLEWPPPETVELNGYVWTRLRYSQLTDDERGGMTHVFRGAEYELVTA